MHWFGLLLPCFKFILLLSGKAALIALVLCCGLPFLRRIISPAWQHALWGLVFVRLLLLDLASFR